MSQRNGAKVNRSRQTKQRKQQRREGKKKRQQKRERTRAAKKRNQEHLVSILDWLLPDGSIFSKLKLHGNTKWLPRNLVCLVLLMAWSQARNLTDAFDEAIGCYQRIFTSYVPTTYQGLMKALTKWTASLMKILWPLLHQRMEEIGGKFWRIDGWVPIAFDGSRSSAPRTEANENAFSAKNYGKGKTAKYRKKKSKGMRRKKNAKNKAQPQAPQAWITMMWHMGLRLPWQWRLGPSNSSERAHVMEMMIDNKFPINTLFCGDAGFVGYPLWSAILNRGKSALSKLAGIDPSKRTMHFLVRVGANVSLLRESADYVLKKNGIVLCWPKGMQSKQPPLRLRLVKVSIGKTSVYLLTSVLDPKKLTIKQMVKLYKMRWGIEVEFRGLKQTLDRAKLRCHNDQRLLAELNWSIMGMAVAELFALKEQFAKRSQKSRKDRPIQDPVKRSLAKTVRAIRKCMRHLNEVPKPGEDLHTQLAEAQTDSYKRKGTKRARYRPKNPDKKPLGKPKVRKITAAEKKKMQEIKKKMAA